MAATGGIIVNSLNVVKKYGISFNFLPTTFTQIRNYAARKGTRERHKKKKIKVEVKKLTWAERVAKSKRIVKVIPDMLDNDEKKMKIVDDVYVMKYFQTKVVSLEEAVQCMREDCHPTQLDWPQALIYMRSELNMMGVKKTRTIESFHRTVLMKHIFNHGETRTVLALSKDEDDVTKALVAGATHAGGIDVIKHLQSGEVALKDFNVFIAHPNILPDLLVVRGLLKKNFPSLANGTLGPDLASLVKNQLHGIRYHAKAYPEHPEHGKVDIPIGTEDMELGQLEDNLRCAVESIMTAKPKRSGSFIDRIRLFCPVSEEFYKIDHELYVPKEIIKKSNVKVNEELEEELEGEEFAVPAAQM